MAQRLARRPLGGQRRLRILTERKHSPLQGQSKELGAGCRIRSRIKNERWIQMFEPSRVDRYLDKIRIWSKQRISKRCISRLERAGAKVFVRAECAYFDHHYKYRLEIYQLQSSAFFILDELPTDAIVNYVEVVCDVICPDELTLERMAQTFLSGFLQPHHRGKQAYVYETDDHPRLTGFTTRKSPKKGSRRRGFWFQWYIDRESRITGELNCFHFEGKHEGSRAVKRLGISYPRDIASFSFDAYFSKYVGTLYEIDFERLGRCHSNRRTGGRRKKPFIDEYGRNLDLRVGHLIYRVLSLHPQSMYFPFNSLQRFTDRYGRGPFLKPYSIMFMGTNTVTS